MTWLSEIEIWGLWSVLRGRRGDVAGLRRCLGLPEMEIPMADETQDAAQGLQH